MAAKKNVSSVKGAEAILEALEIYRQESAEQAENPKVRFTYSNRVNSIIQL